MIQDTRGIMYNYKTNNMAEFWMDLYIIPILVPLFIQQRNDLLQRTAI